eukprot:2964683-Prymnesium_polylepis.1
MYAYHDVRIILRDVSWRRRAATALAQRRLAQRRPAQRRRLAVRCLTRRPQSREAPSGPGARRKHRAACGSHTGRVSTSPRVCAHGAQRWRRAGSGWAAHGGCACGTRVGRQRTGSVV